MRCVSPRPHERDRPCALIDVGYLRLGEEREATELFAAVAAERRWIGTEPPVDIDARTAGLTGSIATGRQMLIVARIANGIVGTLGLYRTPSRDEHSLGLGMLVDAAHRGIGVGAALLAFALGHARKHAVTSIVLDVFPHNNGARALYRKFGFVGRERLVEHLIRADGARWDVIRCELLLSGEESRAEAGTSAP